MWTDNNRCLASCSATTTKYLVGTLMLVAVVVAPTSEVAALVWLRCAAVVSCGVLSVR